MSNKQLPEIVIPKNIAPIVSEKITLDNGLDFHTINNSDQGVVRLSLVFKAGTKYQTQPFSATATANLLSEGTDKFSASEIAEKLDFIGSYFDVSVDRDYAIITFCTLKKFLRETLEIAEQIICHPSFPKKELTTYCSKRKARIEIERTKVAFKARELFAATLFGEEHPYGISTDEKNYDLLKTEHIKNFYQQYYCAENCFAVSSGELDSDATEQMVKMLLKLKNRQKPEDKTFPEIKQKSEAYLEQSDAVQSAIRIGTLFFSRMHPDFIAMQVACTVLGGYFGSRLVKVLREERGYTYGVFSGMVNLDHSGYMAIATEVAAEATDHSVELIFEEIERLRQEKVSEEELQMVKNIVVGEIMRIMDGPFGVVDITIENIQNKTDNSYLNLFLKQISEITPEKIQEVTTKYWKKENFTTVIVGLKN